MTNHPRSICFDLLANVIFATTLFAQQSPPPTLTTAGAHAPFYVSAASATERDGSLRWSAFDSPTQFIIQRRIAASQTTRAASQSVASATEPCQATVHLYHVSGRVDSLDAMIATAPAVYRGQIISITPGFEMGSPSILIGVQITHAVRTATNFPSKGIVYVLYPKADFAIAGTRFCNGGLMGSYSPSTGDRMLIFSFDPPRDTTSSFLLTRPQQLVFEHGGTVFASKPLDLSNRPELESLQALENTIPTMKPEQP